MIADPVKIPIVIHQDHTALAAAVARRMAEIIRQKPNAVLGLPTGSTPKGIYGELVKLHKQGLLLPAVSAEEAALVEGVPVYRIRTLEEAMRFLAGDLALHPLKTTLPAAVVSTDGAPDFAEIKGQHAVRRAVEVAVAGGHNILRLYPFHPIQ